MSAFQPRVYRFASPATWSSCVVQRFDLGTPGGLAPIPRLGLRARRDTADGPVSAVAVGSDDRPLWRVGWKAAALRQWSALDAPSAPFGVAGILAASPRWIVDRRWLWAFDPDAPRVGRWDRDAFEPDLVLDLGDPALAGDVERIVDIASDWRGGLWLLVRSRDATEWLVHVDCKGRVRARHRPPCEAGSLAEIGTVGSGATLVLLPANPEWLWMLAADGSVRRALQVRTIAPCWRPTRLATDARNRIALGGPERDRDRDRWALVVLDGTGELLDGPLGELFSPAPPTARRRGAASASPLPPIDLAVRGDTVWFAMPDGLWHLDGSEACGARESTSVVLTPLLSSPPTSTYRGWLRAEVTIDLPRGAALEAEWVCTDDPAIAERAARLAADSSLSGVSKRESVWALFEPPPAPPGVAGARVMFTGPTGANAPLAVPLFTCQKRWLALRLTLTIPPSTTPPVLREVRVLYPDVSIAQHLPAIFRGTEGDPTGFLRSLTGVLESTSQRIDEKIRALGSYVDPETAPTDWLDYLARWIDLPWDDALPETAKRCLLQHAGTILERRGTRAGLERVLECVLGQGGAAIDDVTVDHAPVRLGSGTLPALLAGVSSRVPVLGAARLGRLQLARPSMEHDPLRSLVPALRIVLTASRARQREIGPLVDGMLAHYLPAGLRVSTSWRIRPALLAPPPDGDGMRLDADGPALLDDDSVLGRTVLAGRGTGRIRESGLEVGFRLN